MIESSAVLAAVKDALRAPLRGGLQPSLTAAARDASGCRRPGRRNGPQPNQETLQGGGRRPACKLVGDGWKTSGLTVHITTDHVFGMCHLLGHRFAPRIKDLKDRKLYAVEKPDTYPVLKPLIGDAVDTAALIRGWAELMRVRASIEAGAVAPSTILRKLAASGPDDALSRALRALGRIERTLFTLQWLSDPALRQRSHAGQCSSTAKGSSATARSRTRVSGHPG